MSQTLAGGTAPLARKPQAAPEEREPLCGQIRFCGAPTLMRSAHCRTWPRVMRTARSTIAIDGWFVLGGRLYLGRTQEECTLIAAALEQDLPAFLARVENGFFNVVLHDHERRRTRFASDRFGALPLYLCNQPDRLAFASTYRGLKRTLGRALRPDPVGTAEMYWFGYPLGERTSYEGVRHLPAGSVLTVRWDNGRQTVERHTERIEPPPLPNTLPGLAGHVVELMTRASRRLHRADAVYGAKLSAGMDSRLVCGTWPDDRVRTYTHGYPGSAEMRLGAALARALGMPHTRVPVEGDFFTRLNAPVFEDFGIAEFFHQASLPAMRSDGVELVLDGLGGDVLLGGLTLKRAIAPWRQAMGLAPKDGRWPETDEDVADYILARIRVPDAAFKPLCAEAAKRLADAWEGVHADMIDQVRAARPAASSFQQLYTEVLFRNRTRRLISLQGTCCRPDVETLYPFLDRDLVALMGRIPEAWVSNKRLYLEIYTRHLPALRSTPGLFSLLPYTVPLPLHFAGRVARYGMERAGLALAHLTRGRLNPWAADGIQWRRWLVFNEPLKAGAREFMRPSAAFDDAAYVRIMNDRSKAAQVSGTRFMLTASYCGYYG